MCICEWFTAIGAGFTIRDRGMVWFGAGFRIRYRGTAQ